MNIRLHTCLRTLRYLIRSGTSKQGCKTAGELHTWAKNLRLKDKSENEVIKSGAFNVNVNGVRFRHRKQGNPEESEDESDDEEYPKYKKGQIDEDGGTIKTKFLKSLRADSVIKATHKFSRRKIDESFLNQRVKINGKPLGKKGKEINVGDMIEIFDDDDENGKYITKIIVKEVVPNFDNAGFDIAIAVHKKWE